MFTVAVAYLLCLTFVVPNRLKNLKTRVDMRPIMLIFYGFQFGIHGIGLCLFSLTMDLSTSWTCDRVNQSATDVKTMGLIYAAYVFFLVKVVGLLEPALQSITNTAFTKDRNLVATSARLVFLVCLVMSAMKANPGHAFLWIAVSDMAVESVYYGYRALTSASSEMLPNPTWKTALSLLRVTHAFTLMVHGLFLSSFPVCSMPKSVAFIECVYALLIISLETLDFVRSAAHKTHTRANHKTQ